MGRKGKDKGGLPPERIGSTLDSFLAQEGIDVMPREAHSSKLLRDKVDEWDERTPLETAPTEECTAHVADVGAEKCTLCGKPLQLMSTGEQKLAVMRRDVRFTEIEQSRGVQLSELWHDRLVQLAKRNNMTPEQYAEHLIKRQWIASGGGRG